MLNICFHEAQISWNNIFSVNNIWVTMKNDGEALSYLNKYCKKSFPITLTTYDCGFPYI